MPNIAMHGLQSIYTFLHAYHTYMYIRIEFELFNSIKNPSLEQAHEIKCKMGNIY
jgi:hypothetical protein